MSNAPDQEETENPYATSAVSRPVPFLAPWEDREFSLGKSMLVWSSICSISAAPSFFLAVGLVGFPNIPWMVIGVLLFVGGYVAVDRMTFEWAYRRRVAVKLSLRLTYIIRISASVIFPVALYADMFCGIFSATFITALGYEPERSSNMPGPVVLIWTLLQGTILNAVLAFIWLILLGICWVLTNEPASIEVD
ncbi:MAG: hypothetical protein NTY15_17890 [Planctomycetota bacterium]|nr:hypothetical protein [Planctomycetota bacterium]